MAEISFNRQCTLEQAKESTDRNCIYFPTDSTSIVVGGKEYARDTSSWQSKSGIINLSDSECIRTRVNSGGGVYVVSDANNQVCDSSVSMVTVSASNYSLLTDTLYTESVALDKIISSSAVYYNYDSAYQKINLQQVRNQPCTPTLRVGDRLLIMQRKMKRSEFLASRFTLDSNLGTIFMAYKESLGLANKTDEYALAYIADRSKLYGSTNGRSFSRLDDSYIYVSDFLILSSYDCEALSHLDVSSVLSPATTTIKGTVSGFAAMDEDSSTYNFEEETQGNVSAYVTLGSIAAGRKCIIDVWAFWREGASVNTSPDVTHAFVEARLSGSVSLLYRPVRTLASESMASHPSTPAEARAAFDADRYRNTFVFNNTSDSTATIYLRVQTTNIKDSWCCLGGYNMSVLE